MTIELITTYYREEFLLPMFALHYESWVDRITLLTNKLPGAVFDDGAKMQWVNDAIGRSSADWVVLVDMDEFIYPAPYGCNPRQVLENERGDIIMSHMTRMWRHRSESDIDRMRPPVPQRTHGQPDHVKPCVFRPKGVIMGVGNHNAHTPSHYKWGKPWVGSHWANADQAFWIDRETRDRGPRLSAENRARGYGTHTLRSRDQILAECAAHMDDPQIISP